MKGFFNTNISFFRNSLTKKRKEVWMFQNQKMKMELTFSITLMIFVNMANRQHFHLNIVFIVHFPRT